jgi:putative phosphoesterase
MPWLVMADTHWPRHGRALPAWLLRAAEVADGILHAGDLTDPALLDILESCAPTWAVAGNGDPRGHPRLPERRLLRLGGLRVGLTHGHLGRAGDTTPGRAAAAFAGHGVDLVVFGHSHQPLFTRSGGRWLLNPGSPTERRRAPACTAAWLAEEDGEPRVTWIGQPG